MADLEDKIRRTLSLVREALQAIEADPAVFSEAVKRAEKAANSPLAIPADKPDVVLRQIERVLVDALVSLETM